MNICIFGSASNLIDTKYLAAGEQLGEYLARAGHRLVFGGGREGMMGAMARGFRKENGYIIGVIPEFFKQGRFEQLYQECNEVIYTPDIPERLRQMQQRSEAFIATPGGAGTYEEFFEVLVSKSLDRHDKPLALLNVDGYFDPLQQMLEIGVRENFISEQCFRNFRSFGPDQLAEMEKYLLGEE